MSTEEISGFLKTEFIEEFEQNEVKVEVVDTKQDNQENFRCFLIFLKFMNNMFKYPLFTGDHIMNLNVHLSTASQDT